MERGIDLRRWTLVTCMALVMALVTAAPPEAGASAVLEEIAGVQFTSGTRSMVVFDGEVFFAARDDGFTTDGLWKVDSVSGEAVLVKAIAPANTAGFGPLVEIDGSLYFVASDPANGRELWRSDGTGPGTERVTDINPGPASTNFGFEFVPFAGEIYFSANDGSTGYELWALDPTTGVVRQVVDLFPGLDDRDDEEEDPRPGSGSPSSLTVFDGALYFGGDNGTSGRELFRTLGTAGTTTLVKDIYPGLQDSGLGRQPNNGFAGFLTVWNGSLYFKGRDANVNFKVWRSDGTAAGTVLDPVADPGPGAILNPGRIYSSGAHLWFSTAYPNHGLWRLDADAGLVQVAANVTVPTLDPTVGELGYFRGEEIIPTSPPTFVDGAELWFTDGTALGAVQVADINPGADSSSPHGFTLHDGEVYFAARDGGSNFELWKTDGTTTGTVLAADVNPGPNGSGPGALTSAGDALYFWAQSAEGPSRVWRLDTSGPQDQDGDGIPDPIDDDPTIPSTSFSDGGSTFGEITANPESLAVTFSDLPDPDGVTIVVEAGVGQVTIRVCGGFNLQIPAGSQVNVTCGSVILEVVSGGPAVVEPPGDGVTFVSVPAGVEAEISDPTDDEFTVTHEGGESPVTVTYDGVVSTVGPGDPPTGFTSNVVPTIEAVDVPQDPVAIGDQPVPLSVGFTDPGVDDTHTCVIDWGDGTTTSFAASDLACSTDHTYGSAGVYTITSTVADGAGESDPASVMVVVYDPDGGFVTGGGWIDSVAGAYVADPLAAGRASFGFVSRYRKGASTPTGNTEFRFRAGDLALRSTDFDWLVVTGSGHARFKGAATINGSGDFRFQVWAGDATGPDGADTFRIKVWSEDEAGDETLVYDNGDDQAIGGGSIVVHSG